jgi:hypothetical protein
MEGLWAGMRDFLRPFRGVNKKYLYQYVAVFEWGYNVKRATPEFLWALLGVRSATSCPTSATRHRASLKGLAVPVPNDVHARRATALPALTGTRRAASFHRPGRGACARVLRRSAWSRAWRSTQRRRNADSRPGSAWASNRRGRAGAVSVRAGRSMRQVTGGYLQG